MPDSITLDFASHALTGRVHLFPLTRTVTVELVGGWAAAGLAYADAAEALVVAVKDGRCEVSLDTNIAIADGATVKAVG